jgi:hypothetical protein
MDSKKDKDVKTLTPRSRKRFSFSFAVIEDSSKEYPFRKDFLPVLSSSLKDFFRLHFDELSKLAGKADFSLYVEGAIEKISMSFLKENRREIDAYCKKHEKEKEEAIKSPLFAKDTDPEDGYRLYLLSFPFRLLVSEGEEALLIRVVPKSLMDKREEDLDNRVSSLDVYLTYFTKDQMLHFLQEGMDNEKILTHALSSTLEEKGETV